MAPDGDFEHFERILRANLPVAVPGRLHPAGRLADFGLDSLLLIQLVVQLEEAFEVDIPDELLTARTFETVDSLWTVLCGLAGPAEGFG
jgi:acyl carrier protein